MKRLALLAALLCSVGAQAQTPVWPTRQIHMVVAYAPGGAVDAVARKLGVALGESLGQQVIIDNRPGASGNIGGEYVSKAPADGYTLLFAPSTLLANPLVMKAKPAFDVEHDLTAVSLVASGPLLMLVPPSGPATLSEFIAQARAHPERINFGTGGFGSAPHLSAEYFKQLVGINSVPTVLYRGSAPAMTDLIGGQLSAIMEASLSAMPQVRGGKVRALAITSDKRDPLFPDVPTFAEAGLKGMEFSTWYGVWAPAGLPDAIRQKLIDTQKTVLTSPDFEAWLGQQGYAASPLSGAAFSVFLQNESKRYQKIVQDGHVQPQ